MTVATNATTNAGVKSLYSLPPETVSINHPPSKAVRPYPAVPHALWAPYFEPRSGPGKKVPHYLLFSLKMSDIKSLIKKRASIKAKLTQFSSYLNVAKSCEQLSEVQIVEVEYRLNIFENLYDKYDMLQTDIEETVDDPSEQYAEREEFEKQYYTLVAAARQLISINNHVQSLFSVQSISKESSKSLRHIVDTTNKNLRALSTLGQPVEYWDTLIIYIMASKLDQVTNREWEEHRNSLSEPPTLAVFIEFISNRADLLETLEESKSLFSKGEGVHLSLLSTALVNVSDAEGNLHTARVLLDNGSTANLISKDLARKLNISTYTVESKVRGINDQSSYCTQGCSISFNSINSEYEIDIDCYVMPKISSSVPNTYIDAHNISIPTNIVLADPQFYVPSSIDILVGAEVFWNVIGTNRIELGKSMPTLFESKLGWLLSGVITQRNSSSHLCLLADNLQADLDQTVTTSFHIDTFNHKDNIISKLFTTCSDFNKIQRFTAYLLKFINIKIKKEVVHHGPLTSKELNSALHLILRLCQQESFSEEYELLSAGKDLPAKNKLLSLSPFFDKSSNLIRVGGSEPNGTDRQGNLRKEPSSSSKIKAHLLCLWLF
ncbi:hypothetical protein SFRURICE_005381 [Spodoptera frugiperda]|nr:hypothetical protein SFRURICE_005381 [Spodoptera frugiperda]